ncbi:tRNA glutamyl-Q(34) synthetase GluQRS [Candidatus Poriferisodalis sp.]|uniref:tRNA glutamyl-Q(34) synthetase GluQRS n=1 Tax=Candidatus Poriferisodalis sp. TaxID=3101277 RepID=UPI003B519B4B
MSEDPTTGRWAPSPTGDLHLGNLRTALLAWLFARSVAGQFLWRFEDLDGAVRPQFYDSQLRDVAALGLDWDGEPVRQSDRLELYRDAIAELRRRGLTYECFCTRREIAEATAAPHGPSPEGAYPGTCRQLTRGEREQRRSDGRPPALRLRVEGAGAGHDDGVVSDRNHAELTVTDRQLGAFTSIIDDFVLQRGDGTPAYNLAVVVDDAAQGINQVVRGDDLLPSTPRQVHLAELLGVEPPSYAHVPLVLGPQGQRLAKRDGAVTLSDRRALGETPLDVTNLLVASLGLEPITSTQDLAAIAAVFDPAALPSQPWVCTPPPAGDKRDRRGHRDNDRDAARREAN